MKLRAYAKINLGLDVLGTRPDGYHDVCMVMQTIALHDLVTVEKDPEPGIHLSCSRKGLPVDERNIAWKAAQLLLPEGAGVRIHLEKHIPVAAGMAGGSTNAAAVLKAMNQLFELGLDTQELLELGVKLGADVPYCIVGGTMRAEGIGEILTPLPPMPNCFILTANPGYAVSTREIYEKMDGSVHPDIKSIEAGLAAGSLSQVAQNIGNAMERVTCEMHPDLNTIKEVMLDAGALASLMSGSGPTIFGIFERRSQATAAARKLTDEKLAGMTYVSVPVNRGKETTCNWKR